jgi:hypothetical protein
LTDDDLFLDQQTDFEEANNDTEEQDNAEVKEFMLKEFEDIFRAVKALKQKKKKMYTSMLALTSIEACKFA